MDKIECPKCRHKFELTDNNCSICKRALDQPDDATTLDCGGDCLRCMAESGDPECIESMRLIRQEQNKHNGKD